MNEIPVTGCIPCFNGAATLRRALQGLRNQTQALAEIILVDDGSSDSSAKIGEEFGARVIRFEENLGRGAARARAVEEARTELILFCDARVELDTVFCEKALRWFERPEVAAAFGPVLQGGTTLAERWRSRHLFKMDAPTAVNRKALLSTGGVLMRSSAILTSGNFDPKLRIGEDAELGERLLKDGFHVIFDPDLRINALGHDSVTQVLERYRRWNGVAPASVFSSDYLRQIAYSLKVMAKADLKNGDLGCALISLAMPHFCLVQSRRKPLPPRREE